MPMKVAASSVVRYSLGGVVNALSILSSRVSTCFNVGAGGHVVSLV